MARATALGLACGLFPTGPLHDAVLESFVIHARNLAHFFFPERPYPSDVLAEHYFATPQDWDVARGGLPPSFVALRGRANKELAHLTYDRLRVAPEAKGWNIPQLINDILALVSRFLSSVSRSLLSSQWPVG